MRGDGGRDWFKWSLSVFNCCYIFCHFIEPLVVFIMSCIATDRFIPIISRAGLIQEGFICGKIALINVALKGALFSVD